MKKIVVSMTAFAILILAVLGSNLTEASASITDRRLKYFSLSSPEMIIPKGPEGAFDYLRTHTMSIIELNKNGYRFWGYYHGYDGKNINHAMGVAYSNDLVNWVKEGKNPVIPDLRWGTVVVTDGIVNMFGTRDYRTDSRIVRLTSEDGLKFTEQETVIPAVSGQRHQNPFIYYDEKNQTYRLYYFHRVGKDNYLEEKHSIDIAGLAKAQSNVLLHDSKNILAAPSIMYRMGKYWLTAETLHKVNGEDTWKTIAYVSNSPDKGFVPVRNREILVDRDACFFPYIFDNRIEGVYSHEYADGTWELYKRTHDFRLKNKITLDKTEINLGSNDSVQLKVTFSLPDGETKDVTESATWATSDNSISTIKKGKLTAVNVGNTIITVSYGGCSTTAAVSVKNSQ